MILELAIGTIITFGALFGVVTILPWRSSYTPRLPRADIRPAQRRDLERQRRDLRNKLPVDRVIRRGP